MRKRRRSAISRRRSGRGRKPRRAGARSSKRSAKGNRRRRKTSAWAVALAPRAAEEKRYWLVKSEPHVFSFDDLLHRHNKTTHWDGVRNFVARNFLRDGMKLGDRVFFYHSSTDAPGIVGICEVVREAYPDGSALDAAGDRYDPKATRENPIWFMVDLRAVAQFTHPVPLSALKARRELKRMTLLRIGRLSVTPVTAAEWDTICAMAS